MMVLVNGQGSNAFHRFALRSEVETMVNQVSFHAKIIRQAHASGFANLRQNHMHHQGRSLVQTG
jgi:hypothetical protein